MTQTVQKTVEQTAVEEAFWGGPGSAPGARRCSPPSRGGRRWRCRGPPGGRQPGGAFNVFHIPAPALRCKSHACSPIPCLADSEVSAVAYSVRPRGCDDAHGLFLGPLNRTLP